MKSLTVVSVAALAALLSGCAGTLNIEQQAKLDAAERLQGADRLVQDRIAESAASIANTLQLIERIERGPATPRGAAAPVAGAPVAAVPEASPAAWPQSAPTAAGALTAAASAGGRTTAVMPNGPSVQSGYVADLMDSRLRIQWKNGSADELLRTLAKQMGIPYKAIGEKHAINPVTVVSENDSMSSILASVGRQVDQKADVVLNTSQQQVVLELRYK